MPATDGLVVLDKPAGMTSHDVVARVRRLAGTRRVGHAGTLDPMATGVLVVGVERATRLLTFLVGADKEYEATIRLGAATVTDDREGEITSVVPVEHLDDVALSHAVQRLTGVLSQVPSAVSAVKVDGRRAYDRVRAGEEVALEPRRVTVRRFEVLSRRAADLDGVPVVDVDVRVACSSGTYIRALARDLGADLEVGGHLTALRRTRVGRFGLADTVTLADAEREFSVQTLPVVARHLFPVWELDAEQARRLSHGMRLAAGEHPEGVPVAAFAPDGTLVAITAVTGPVARPLLVVAPA